MYCSHNQLLYVIDREKFHLKSFSHTFNANGRIKMKQISSNDKTDIIKWIFKLNKKII